MLSRLKVLLALALWLVPLAANAGEVALEGRLVQGGLVYGTVTPGAAVTLDGRTVRVTAEGRFVFGFGRDAAPQARLEVRFPDGRVETRELTVAKRAYEIQRIDGLPSKMVTPPEDVLARIRAEAKAIAAARAHDGAEPYFQSGFVWPVTGPITGVFGSQRVLNGEPRRPHFGVDIAAPAGTTVRAPADGVVTVARPDMYFTGGTVLVDHGHGLTSAYSHLREVFVDEGQVLRQGDPLGSVGATGRATGAHLDWRINWFDQRLDPALLVPPMRATAD